MIRWAEDLGAPAVVAAADILTDQNKPSWNPWVGIGLAAVGIFGGGFMGIGGPFVKNIGIASLPWAYRAIYEKIKNPVNANRGAAALNPGARFSGNLGRSYAPEFDAIRAW